MRKILLIIVLVLGCYIDSSACSILAEDIPFCNAAKADYSLIARGKIVEKFEHGIIMELYEVYRGEEDRCEIKVFERPAWDCNGLIFNYDIKYFGEVGQVVLFYAEPIETLEHNWEEEGEYRTLYADIKGYGQFIKPMIQQGNKVKGLFAKGINAVKIDQIAQKLADCGVEGLLPDSRPLCGPHALNIYPNPATDIFYIKDDIGVEGEVKLYDMSGKLVMQKSAILVGEGLKLGALPSGMYLVVAQSGSTTFHQKLLINR